MLTGQIGFHILLSAANQTPAPVALLALLDSPFQVEPGTSRLPAPPAPLVGALLEGVARWRLGGWMIVGPLCAGFPEAVFMSLVVPSIPQCFQVCPGSGMEKWMNEMSSWITHWSKSDPAV